GGRASRRLLGGRGDAAGGAADTRGVPPWTPVGEELRDVREVHGRDGGRAGTGTDHRDAAHAGGRAAGVDRCLAGTSGGGGPRLRGRDRRPVRRLSRRRVDGEWRSRRDVRAGRRRGGRPGVGRAPGRAPRGGGAGGAGPAAGAYPDHEGAGGASADHGRVRGGGAVDGGRGAESGGAVPGGVLRPVGHGRARGSGVRCRVPGDRPLSGGARPGHGRSPLGKDGGLDERALRTGGASGAGTVAGQCFTEETKALHASAGKASFGPSGILVSPSSRASSVVDLTITQAPLLLV